MLGQQARETAQKRFSWKAVADILDEVYIELASFRTIQTSN